MTVVLTPEQRDRLQRAVDQLGRALAEGDDDWLISIRTTAEFLALAGLCDDAHLPIEAARVRSWIAEMQRERWLNRPSVTG